MADAARQVAAVAIDNISGSKRTIAVDVLGLPHAVRVTGHRLIAGRSSVILDRMGDATTRQDMDHAIATLPPREARVSVIRFMLARARRRQRPGAGSSLSSLMSGPRETAVWWNDVAKLLSDAGVPSAAMGAVAANQFMPPRQTADLDLAVALPTLPRAQAALVDAGWMVTGELALYEGEGIALEKDGQDLDVIGLPEGWGQEAVAAAQGNVRDGIPHLTRPFVVVSKLVSARVQDAADITRIMGQATDAETEEVREAVARHRPDDAEDLDGLIWSGKLEAGQDPAAG